MPSQAMVMNYGRLACVACVIAIMSIAPGAWPLAAGTAATQITTHIVYLGKQYPEPPPLSLVDKIITDKGIQGARLALRDTNQTGGFIGQSYQLTEVIVAADGDVSAKARELLAGGAQLIVADLSSQDLLAVADLPEAVGAIIFNIRESDDRLRQENCRANLYHLPPGWAMRADALAQYLNWKRWQRWFLIAGKQPADLDFVQAIKRSARRFGAKVVTERTYAFEAGSRRTDTGHQQIQTQMPLETQNAAAHDVVFVADVGEAFGDYLLYRTFEPKPVVGTHGLVAVAWHRSFEQFAATQMQNSFEELTHRIMTERDYFGWLAVRIVGEAVLRTNKNSVADIREYILSDTFGIAGFKGQALTFRRWDQQLRQPVLLSGARALVSISPQDGFLHPKYLTDTLGFDEPESKCQLTQ